MHDVDYFMKTATTLLLPLHPFPPKMLSQLYKPTHLTFIKSNITLPLMKNTVTFEKRLMDFLPCMFAQYARNHT